jgi:hypothetical protein
MGDAKIVVTAALDSFDFDDSTIDEVIRSSNMYNIPYLPYF